MPQRLRCLQRFRSPPTAHSPARACAAGSGGACRASFHASAEHPASAGTRRPRSRCDAAMTGGAPVTLRHDRRWPDDRAQTPAERGALDRVARPAAILFRVESRRLWSSASGWSPRATATPILDGWIIAASVLWRADRRARRSGHRRAEATGLGHQYGRPGCRLPADEGSRSSLRSAPGWAATRRWHRGRTRLQSGLPQARRTMLAGRSARRTGAPGRRAARPCWTCRSSVGTMAGAMALVGSRSNGGRRSPSAPARTRRELGQRRALRPLWRTIATSWPPTSRCARRRVDHDRAECRRVYRTAGARLERPSATDAQRTTGSRCSSPRRCSMWRRRGDGARGSPRRPSPLTIAVVGWVIARGR